MSDGADCNSHQRNAVKADCHFINNSRCCHTCPESCVGGEVAISLFPIQGQVGRLILDGGPQPVVPHCGLLN
jgi:hypothetical protein